MQNATETLKCHINLLLCMHLMITTTIYKQMGIDLPEFNGDNSYELPLPATYIVGSEGIVKLAFADVDYTKRLEPDTVIETLKALND